MNENKYGALVLFLFILLIAAMVWYSPKSPKLDMQQKYKQSQHRADSLQNKLNQYEAIKPELIKLYYENKFNEIHDEVDSSTIYININILKELLSN